jgi:cell wall-associated NlpC family hydrolase
MAVILFVPPLSAEDWVTMNRVTTSAVVTAVLTGAVIAGAATPASATTVKARAYAVAKAQKNDPYRRGGVGPRYFDCSGLTQYAYKGAGKKLPHNAQRQYNATRHIKRSQLQVGDLVFFGNPATHVGIYAGGGKIWNANSGHYRGYKVVLAPIREYGGPVRYGQVR